MAAGIKTNRTDEKCACPPEPDGVWLIFRHMAAGIKTNRIAEKCA
jgi:hypothetical protein